MAERARVVIDADHGGTQDPEAVYYGRKEEDDVLRLVLAVGQILSKDGVDAVYIRVDNIYDMSFEKAMIANNSGADYLVPLHRNAMPTPNTVSGSEMPVHEDSGVSALMARNISEQLRDVGFLDLGVIEWPGLVVSRRMGIPAVLVEAGFADSEADNRFLDDNFGAIAEAIAQGILNTIEQEREVQPQYFQIQTGAYQDQALAERQAGRLEVQGFPVSVVCEDGLYKAWVGVFLNTDNAAQVERDLREYGYNTLMVRSLAALQEPFFISSQ